MTSLPLPGPDKAECGGRQESCSLMGGGCPLFGRLLAPSRDGKRRVRGCGDPVARGGRNRKKGGNKSRPIRKVLELPGANTTNEEHYGGVLRVESKAGAKGGANKVLTAYKNARAQSDAAKAIGDTRPFAALFHPDGTSRTLIVIRDDDWPQVIAAYTELGP